MTPPDHLLPAGKETKLLEAPHPHHISAGKIILILLVLAAIVIAVGLAGFLPRRSREQAAAAAASSEKNTLPKVTAAPVRRSLRDTEFSLPGTLTPLTEASIFARAAGYVRRRYVDMGDHVRAGQLLAEIDAPELDQQVAQAKAAVSQAQQQLAQTQAALVQAQSQRDLARVTAQRYTNLLAKGAVARQEADTQQSGYKSAEAMVAAQEANIRASEENVRQSQASLERVIALQEYKSVKAPFAGVVTVRNVDAGSLISASGAGQGASPTGTGGVSASSSNEMFRVAQISTIRTLINVPQANVEGIRVGMAATVTVNELPGRIFTGKVARTASSLDPNTRTMLVEVQIPNSDGRLLPGMYADIHFKTHRDSPPLLAPGDTLISTNAGQQVAVLRDAGNGSMRVHLQAIQTGRDYGAETEVMSGLQGDELLVVNPGDEVREGALVKAEAAPKK